MVLNQLVERPIPSCSALIIAPFCHLIRLPTFIPDKVEAGSIAIPPYSWAHFIVSNELSINIVESSLSVLLWLLLVNQPTYQILNMVRHLRKSRYYIARHRDHSLSSLGSSKAILKRPPEKKVLPPRSFYWLFRE